MSYQSIPNQPIIFRTQQALDANCGCGINDFKQLVDVADELSFQLTTEPCEYSVFGGDITLAGTWEEDGSSIVAPTASGASFYSQPYFPQQPDQIFAVTLTVEAITGTLTVGMTGASTQNLTVPGTYTLFFNSTHLFTNPSINLVITGATFVGSFVVNGVTSAPSNVYVALVDANTLEYIAEITPIYTLQGNTITANFTIPEGQEGCTRLAISDYCLNVCGQHFVFNGMFAPSGGGVAGWTSDIRTGTADWVVNTNEASIELDEGDQTGLVSVTEVCADKQYTITVEVESINNATLAVVVNDVFYSPVISGTGTQTVTFTPTSAGNLELVATALDRNAGVTISRITIEVAPEDVEYSYFSDVLDIGDYSDPCKFFRIEGCNGEDQFDFAFSESNFFPGIRLQARRHRAQYTTDVDVFRYASGRWDVPYADRVKRYTYSFVQLPEYVLDFLSVVVYFDNLYINGSLYFPLEGEFPDVSYNDANDNGNIDLELALKQDKVRKTRCIGVDAQCLPTVIDSLTGDFLITQANQPYITQGGDFMIQE